jgi:hypothetical protein
LTSIAAGQSAFGNVQVADDKTAVTYASAEEDGALGPSCTFSVQSQPGEQLGVAAGRIWASIVCPRIKDPTSSNPNEACAITEGYVVVENCSQ